MTTSMSHNSDLQCILSFSGIAMVLCQRTNVNQPVAALFLRCFLSYGSLACKNTVYSSRVQKERRGVNVRVNVNERGRELKVKRYQSQSMCDAKITVPSMT